MATPYEGQARIEPLRPSAWASLVAVKINDIDSDHWVATHVARDAIREPSDRYRIVLLSGEYADLQAEATVGYDPSDKAIVTVNGKTPFDDADDANVTAARVVREATRERPDLAVDEEAGEP